MEKTNKTKEEEFSSSSTLKTLRIIDANLNRLREGIRVVEDIRRYFYDDKEIASTLKELRHMSRIEDFLPLLKARDIVGDVLKETTKSESKRENISSVELANIKRAQESSRVLEEIFKINASENAHIFKQIRYTLYDIEKKLFGF